MANTTITPSVGLLRLTTSNVIVPAVAALVLAGLAPQIPVYPGTAALTLASGASTMSYGITPGAGAVTVPGVAPVVGGAGSPALTPAAGTLTLVGIAGSYFAGTITPDAGEVDLVGYAPTNSIVNTTLVPAVAALSLAGVGSIISRGIVPSAGALTFATATVALNFGLNLPGVGTGGLGLLGQVPVMNVGIQIPTGNIALTTTFSPSIAPSAATLAVNGNVPVMNGPRVVVPDTYDIQLNSDVPPQTLSVPAPPCAALVVGGYAPVLTLTHIFVINTGAVALAGAAPGTGGNIPLQTATGALALAGVAPTLARNLFTATGATAFASDAPIVSQGTVLPVPTADEVDYVGVASTLIPGSSIAPPAGTVTLAGIAGKVSAATVTGSGLLFLDASASAPTLDLRITPPTGSVLLAGAVAGVNGRITLVPATGALNWVADPAHVAFGMTVPVATVTLASVRATFDLGITPLGASVALNADAPALNLTGFPQTITGSVTLDSAAPSMNLTILTGTGTTAYTGTQPKVNALQTIAPASGAVLLTGVGPNVAAIGVIIPASGAVQLSGNAPTLLRTGAASPQTGALVMGGTVPEVATTTNGIVVPGTAAVMLTGQPAVVPLYAADPYHTVDAEGPSDYVVKSPG